ncbi:Angiogenic factor with G patch and FHA domains 1 [Branchiostoma belcheri]|nr:Angiogenic factor with G patch and FHA domains 1 [Branchiostoma belcheri]
MQQYPPPSMGGYDWAAAAQWYSQAMAYSQGYMPNMDTTSWAGTGWQDNSSNANWQTGMSQENKEGMPDDNQMGGPPDNQMPNNQMGGQQGNNQMGGPPSNNQMGGPTGNQMGGPPGNQMGGLQGNNQMGGPRGNQMGGPPGNQMGGPPGNQMGGPPGNQMGGLQGNQMGGLQGNNQMGGPRGNQMGGHRGNQMGGPPGNQMGGPPGNQMGGPQGNNQMGGPPGNQMGGPQGNQMGGPNNQMGMPGNNQMGMHQGGQNVGPGNNWQNRGRPTDWAGPGGFQDSGEGGWTDDGPWQRNQGGRRPGQEKGPKRGILKRKNQHDDSTISANETPLGPPPAKLAGRFSGADPGARPAPFPPGPPDTAPEGQETFGSVQAGPSDDNMDQMWNDFDNEVTVLEQQLIAQGIKKKPGDKQDQPNLPDTRELVIQSLVQMGMPTPTEEAIQNVLQNSALVKQIQQIYIASTAAAAGKDAAKPTQEPPVPVEASIEEREAAIELLMKLKQPITDESIEKILQDAEVMQYIRLQVEKKRALEEAKQAVAAKKGASLVDVDYRRRPAHEEDYRRTPPIPERPGDYRRMAPGMRPEDPGYGYERMRPHEGPPWGRGRPPPPRGREGDMGLRDEFDREEKAEKSEAPGSRRGSFFKPVEAAKRDTVAALYNIDKEKVKGFSTKLLEALKGAREKLGEGKEEKDDHFSKQLTVAFTDLKLQEEMQSLFHSCHQSQDSKEQSQDANGDSLQSTQVSSTSEQSADSQGNLGITQQAIVAFTQALTPHLNLPALLTGQVAQDESTCKSDTKEGEGTKEKTDTGDSQKEDDKKETSEGESLGQTEESDKAKEDPSNENKETQDTTGDSETQTKSDTAISEAAVQSFTSKLIEQLCVLNKELDSKASEDLVKPGPSGEGHRGVTRAGFHQNEILTTRTAGTPQDTSGLAEGIPNGTHTTGTITTESSTTGRENCTTGRGVPDIRNWINHMEEGDSLGMNLSMHVSGRSMKDGVLSSGEGTRCWTGAGRAAGSPALGQRSLSKSPVRELQRRLGGEETRGSLTFEVFEYITEFDKVGKEGDRRRMDGDKDRRSEERRSRERSDSRNRDRGRSPSSDKSKSPKEDDKPKEHSFAFKRQQLKRRAMQFLQEYVREKGHSISVVVLNTVTQNEEFLLEFCDFQDGIMKKSQFYQRVQDYVELADIKMSLSKKGKKFSSLARDADVEDIPEKTFGQPPMQIPGEKKPDNADSDSESESEIDSLRRQKQQLFQKRSNMIKELSRLRDRLDRSLDGEEKAELGTQILEKETDLQNVKAEIAKIAEAMQEKER